MIGKDRIGTGKAVTADVTKTDDCKASLIRLAHIVISIFLLVISVFAGVKRTAVGIDLAAFHKGT